MQQYIFRRLLMAFPVLFFITLVVFGSIRIIPGDAVMSQIAESGNVSKERLAQIRKDLGLDVPVHQQYVNWISGIAQGNLGKSLWSGKNVGDEIKRTVPITTELAILSLVIALVIGLPLGILSAIRQDTLADYIARLVSVGGLSVPDFALGIITLLFLSLYFFWVPPLTYTSPTQHWFDLPLGFFSWDVPRPANGDNLIRNVTQFIFPASILGFRFSAYVMRMARSSMLEVLREDYVRTAWAKGLRERVVVLRHALKNAMIPVTTIIGLQFGYLLGGAVIIEQIFGLPGMGRLTLDAITQRDYPQIQANVLFIALATVIINLLVDVSYAWLIPRIRYR